MPLPIIVAVAAAAAAKAGVVAFGAATAAAGTSAAVSAGTIIAASGATVVGGGAIGTAIFYRDKISDFFKSLGRGSKPREALNSTVEMLESMTQQVSEVSTEVQTSLQAQADEITAAIAVAKEDSVVLSEELEATAQALKSGAEQIAVETELEENETKALAELDEKFSEVVIALGDELQRSQQRCQKLSQKNKEAKRMFRTILETLADSDDEEEAASEAAATMPSSGAVHRP